MAPEETKMTTDPDSDPAQRSGLREWLDAPAFGKAKTHPGNPPLQQRHAYLAALPPAERDAWLRHWELLDDRARTKNLLLWLFLWGPLCLLGVYLLVALMSTALL